MLTVACAESPAKSLELGQDGSVRFKVPHQRPGERPARSSGVEVFRLFTVLLDTGRILSGLIEQSIPSQYLIATTALDSHASVDNSL